ncbi:MAG: hypothetical protein WC455_19710 [Dehalococcoidia bacterium]|jgi:hypothetical protein
MKVGIRKPNSAGLVTTTGGATMDLVHDLVLVAGQPNPRSAVIKKIFAYNNTGGNATIIFGTVDRSAVPLFVAVLPTITLINGFDNELTEEELPNIEFQSNMGLTVAGRSGSIYVLGSVAGLLVTIEVEEFGG